MSSAPRATLVVARLSALFTLVTVTLGSVVCATKSGFDCHSWPGCYPDRFAPGASDIPSALVANPALEMVHRVIAMGTGALVIAAAIGVLRLTWASAALKGLAIGVVLCAGGSALVGRAAVLGLGVTTPLVVLDLLCALAAMGGSLAIAFLLPRGGRFTLTALSTPALTAVGLLTTMHALAIVATGNRSFTRCMSWPVLWLAHDDNFGGQVVRTGLAVAAALAIIVTVRAALAHGLRTHGLALGVLLAAVIVLAIAYRASGTDGGVLGITFSVTSVALLWASVLTALVGGSPAIDDAQRSGDDRGAYARV